MDLPDATDRTYTFTEVTTTFDVTHGNLRLPGEVRMIGLTYYTKDPKPRRDFLVRQIYRNYRFYEVSTSTGEELPDSMLPNAAGQPES